MGKLIALPTRNAEAHLATLKARVTYLSQRVTLEVDAYEAGIVQGWEVDQLWDALDTATLALTTYLHTNGAA